MRMSQALVVGMALAAGYIGGFTVNRPTAGQPPALDPLPSASTAIPTRFQTTVLNNGGSFPLLILTETTTGHCWMLESGPQEDEEWRDLGTPAKASSKH